MKIDVHNHVIPDSAVDLLKRDPAYRTQVEGDQVRGGNHVPFTLFPSFRDPRAKLEELEARGLDAAVVSPAPPIFFYEVRAEAGETMSRATNRGMAEFCAARPDRYRWMAHVPMSAPERASAVLQEAVEEGAVGVEVGTSVAGRRLDEPDFEVFWEAAERLGTPVLIHPAYNEPNRGLEAYYLQNVIGNQLETTVAIERLICAGVLDRHPRLTVVLVHAGGYFPFQAGRLKHARTVRPELQGAPSDPWAYCGQVVFDTIAHDRQALTYLISRVGADNVVMGTDLPFDMATPEPVAALEEAVDQETARLVVQDTPGRLYSFGD